MRKKATPVKDGLKTIKSTKLALKALLLGQLPKACARSWSRQFKYPSSVPVHHHHLTPSSVRPQSHHNIQVIKNRHYIRGLSCKSGGDLCYCQWMLEIIQYSRLLSKQVMDEVKSRGLDGCWITLWPEAVDDFGKSPSSSPKEVTLACSAIQFVNWAKGDIHYVLDSHAAELKEEILEQLTPLSDPDDEKDWHYLQKPKPITIDVQKGLQMADDHDYHSFRVDQFMDRCL